jgi:trimeric autotransporter adhesin
MAAILRRPLRAMLFAAVLCGCGWASSQALAQRVGVNSAVNPEASGTPQGGAPQRLMLGQDVLYNERIATSSAGQTQILFVDASTMTVGPNSNLVIDQFVYDPTAGTGKMAASLTRGVFRFVGGALSKGDNAVTFRTPAATIGIRGGVMLVDVNPACGTATATPETPGCNALQVIFAYGKGVTVTGTGGVSQTITRPGFQVTVAAPGAAPSPPAPAPVGAIGRFLGQLDGQNGKNGGANQIPTDAQVERSSAAVIASTAAPTIQTSIQSQPPSAANTIAQIQLNTQLAQSSGAAVSFTPVVTPSPPPPTPPTTPPINIASVAGGYTDTGMQGTTLGFTAAPLAYAGGNVTNSVFSVTGAFGQVTFPLVAGSASLSPTGAGTTSPLGPVTGTTYLSPDETFFYADLTPVDDPAQREFIYGGLPVGQAFYQTASGTSQILAFAVQPDAALQSPIPFIRLGTGGALSGAGVSPPLIILATPAGSVFSPTSAPTYTKALQASLAINGTGAAQQSVILVFVGNVFGSPATLNGVMHGSYLGNAAGQPIRINSYLATPTDGSGNAFYGGNAISGFVLAPGAGAANAVETNTANQTTVANYQFAQPATPTTVPPGVATGAQSTRTITGWFGGIMTKEAIGGSGTPFSYVLEGSTSISTDATNLQIAATLSGGDPFTSTASGINSQNGMVLQFGSLAPGETAARQAFINDNLFAALESPTASSTVNGVAIPFGSVFPDTNPNLYLVTATAAPPTSLLPNGLCACQYLEWGYWGGEIDTPSDTGILARVDVGHINSWVAGPLTPNMAALEAASAAASYSGNLFGTVDNNGAKYLATGGLMASYNFGTQNGSFDVSNYDGRSFALSGKVPLSGANYSFGFQQNGIVGGIHGSFYGPGAIETGGNFVFRTTTGTPYFTSGIYGARMVAP